LYLIDSITIKIYYVFQNKYITKINQYILIFLSSIRQNAILIEVIFFN